MTTAAEERQHWDAQAGSVQAARDAVWSEPDYTGGVAACRRIVVDALGPHLTPRSQVLDLGCGVGRVLIPTAVLCGRVHFHGVDVSARMLAIAQTDVESWGLDNVRLHHGDGRTLPATVPKLDAAYSMLVLQHLAPDVMGDYLGHVADALRPGGLFLVQFVATAGPGADYSHPHAEATVHAAAKLAGLDMVRSTREVFPQWAWHTYRRRP